MWTRHECQLTATACTPETRPGTSTTRQSLTKETHALPAARRSAEVHLDGLAPPGMIRMLAPDARGDILAFTQFGRRRLDSRFGCFRRSAHRLMSTGLIVEPRPVHDVFGGRGCRIRRNSGVHEREPPVRSQRDVDDRIHAVQPGSQHDVTPLDERPDQVVSRGWIVIAD